ncbi:hypothetical protein DAETH_48500 (plasmid) [Deinococcus aetherius]|uniref:Uncharacterized protein n=1 Tax=Deinococcus aetherius TaxID=200252 RepID=A0ABM8AM16_9DEIO|nr:hypothetical protein [Deinococcus aetherius]BDP44881.1 hypothetical protein DAETH_48500 [Deinococcus aetherius]
MTTPAPTPTAPAWLWTPDWASPQGPFHDPAQLRQRAEDLARESPGVTIHVLGPLSTVVCPPPEPLWDSGEPVVPT